jgi:hypothetical protein
MATLENFGVPTTGQRGILSPNPQWGFRVMFYDKENNNNLFLTQQIKTTNLVVENGSAKLFFELRVPQIKTIKETVDELKNISKFQIEFLDGSGKNLDTITVVENGLLNYSVGLDYTSDNPVTLKCNLDVILKS